MDDESEEEDDESDEDAWVDGTQTSLYQRASVSAAVLLHAG